MPELLLNGNDARAWYGFILNQPDGWLAVPTVRQPTALVPGRAGAIALTAAIDDAPRTLTLRGTLVNATAAGARAALDKLLAALRKSAGTTIVLGDQPTRQITGYLQQATFQPPAGALVAARLPVELSFLCLDPYWYDTTLAAIALSTSADTAIPLGSAPARPVVRVAASGGTCTLTSLTLKNSAGAVAGSMTFTGLTVASGQTLDIDCARLTMSRSGASVLATLTGGDFFVLDPGQLGDFAASAWPTMRWAASAGAGFATVTVRYNKAWR